MKKPSDLRWQEWHFLRCPEEERELRCYYEYARYAPAVVEAVRRLDEQTGGYMECASSSSFAPALIKGFPDAPWQTLPARKRSELVNLLREQEKQQMLIIQRPGRVIVRPPSFPRTGPCAIKTADALTAAIHIDWRQTNQELKAAFHRLLQAYRPKDKKTTRGRANSFVDFLNALGAKRLLDHCAARGVKSPAAAALEIIGRAHKKGQIKDKPYSKESALLDAAKPVDGLLRRFFHFEDESSFVPGCQDPAGFWFPDIFTDHTVFMD